MASLRVFFLSLLFFTLASGSAYAAGEVTLEKTEAKESSPGRYEVSAVFYNHTPEAREVVLRAQLFFFEEFAPAGDLPAMVLRKDETVILKRREGRRVTVVLLNEGTLPKAKLRLKPEIRIRRQRKWQY
jgi:hypothetical protein